jgi:outer membrane receptor for ferrienterochelin and colicins
VSTPGLRPILSSCWLAALPLSLPQAGLAEGSGQQQLEGIVVTATRIPVLVSDEPLRVEAVPAEEIEENMTLQPGNVSTLLAELPGVRAQPSAPALGGARMQLRGMPGRSTQILNDGLPLLGSAPDAFGLLQVPPLDLEQAEVIKGTASALYGGSAMGGVLNLVSRKPGSESGFLVNVTSRGGRDLLGFLATGAESTWSGTLSAGRHDQSRQDIDGDGWADLAASRRYELRPRIWWRGTGDNSLLLTAGVMDELRRGGTMAGAVLPGAGAFPEARDTQRFDLGAVSHVSIGEHKILDGRFALTSTDLRQVFGEDRAASRRTTAYMEEALSGLQEGHRWALGLAFEHDRLSSPDAPDARYSYNTLAALGQDTFSPTQWLSLAASARVDAHSVYGTFFSPRISALIGAPDGAWSLRGSVGSGFAVPTPFVDEVEATWLGAVLPLQGLHAEHATSAAIDLRWRDSRWDVNASVFMSEIRDALQVRSWPDRRLSIQNAPGPWRAPGIELLVGYVEGPLHAIASWSAIHATEIDLGGVRRDAPGIPRQTAAIDAILESEKRGRMGFELEYVGEQALDDNPYRSTSPGFWQLNLLAELRFGEIGVFLNLVNVTDVRQTHHDPLLRPVPGPGGDPITGVWAPLAGRTLNVGIRSEL